MSTETKHVINATVENQPAVLSRIVGLFSGRGYNIETLNVGPCADPRFSRMTITVPGDEHVLEQVTKQLNKLVDVVKVVDLTREKHIARELLLVETGAPKLKRAEVMGIASLFGAQVVGVRENSLTMQYVGREDQVDDFLRLLRPYTILNLARSGLLAVARGD
ncbi:MAG: acetolactate synthase small subunit [Kiritimatiellae bacterium]|nr:acetolactate synthase small subunit [Kiritimatiellia bacterium]